MAIVDQLIAVLGYRLEGKEKLKEFEKGIDNAAKKANHSAMALTKLGGVIGGVVTLGAIKSAVTNFATFERAMNRIGITAGATQQELSDATDGVQRLAKDFALPVDDAVKALDTLTASGKNMKEAMDFLPSVLATAQASGAATQDVANTALKASEALKIPVQEMQKAFDIMVAGGKAGQFELKDMAQYIPELANSYATLGYKGQVGLQKLIATLQTLREDTGSASAAATQAQNIFGKIYSEETSKNFKDFGIDLEVQLKKAAKAGEDTIAAFVRLSNQAIKGDLTKLPKLFSDQEFRLGMQSLMTSADSYKNFIDAVNGSKVEGTVLADLNQVLGDTEAKIQKMSTSWDRFMKAFGAAASAPVGGVLDAASDELDYGEAIRKGLEKRGMKGYWEKENWMLRNTFDNGEKDKAAREGGYNPKSGYHPLGDSKLSDNEVAKKKIETEITEARAMRETVAVSPSPKAAVLTEAVDKRIAALQAQLEQMNSNLANMTGQAQGAVNATITDARQDNRQFPVTVNAPVTVNVQEAAKAPAAVGGAVSGAIQSGAAAGASGVNVQPSRMQAGPAR